MPTIPESFPADLFDIRYGMIVAALNHLTVMADAARLVQYHLECARGQLPDSDGELRAAQVLLNAQAGRLRGMAGQLNKEIGLIEENRARLSQWRRLH